MLFAFMVNDLIRRCLPRAKFVDDLTVIEVQAYAVHNNMCLNPSECKIMAIDFLYENSFQCPPVATCGCVLEKVKLFKFLEVFTCLLRYRNIYLIP